MTTQGSPLLLAFGFHQFSTMRKLGHFLIELAAFGLQGVQALMGLGQRRLHLAQGCACLVAGVIGAGQALTGLLNTLAEGVESLSGLLLAGAGLGERQAA